MRLFLLLLIATVPSATATKKVDASLVWKAASCPGAKGDGEKSVLRLDAIKILGIGPRKAGDNSGEILTQYIIQIKQGLGGGEYPKNAEKKGTMTKVPAPDKGVKSWEVLFYVRLAKTNTPPQFFYGFDPSTLLWSDTKNEDTGNQYRDAPFHLGEMTFKIGKDKKFVIKKYTGSCQEPKGWIGDHGIFRINKLGQFENMYYDPINGMFTPPE